MIDESEDNWTLDYHETDECVPVVYLLGRISIDWNFCEHFFSTLAWQYLGGVKKGLTVTSNLGNQTRADLVLNLARKFEKDAEIIGKIEFAAKAFNRLREIRNTLMHYHAIIPHESGKLEWRRTSSSSPTGHTGSLAGLNDINDVLNYIAKLSLFLTAIVVHKIAIENGHAPMPLPEIFPLPNKLSQVPLEVPKGEPPENK